MSGSPESPQTFSRSPARTAPSTSNGSDRDREVATSARAVFTSVASDVAAHSDENIRASPDAHWYDATAEPGPFCSARGSQAGHLGQGVARTRVEVDVWYYFTPAKKRRYWFFAAFEFNGQYRASSNTVSGGSFHDAQVVVSRELNIHQRVEFGWQSTNILDIRADGIDLHDEFMNQSVHSMSAHLYAGEGAWIIARVRLDVRARGSSSHAELDFGRRFESSLRAEDLYIV